MRSTPAVLIAALALTFAGAPAHATTTGIFPEIQPLILGEVTAIGSHDITVLTPEGEKVALEIDSRTLMPSRLETGTRVRIDFHTLDNGGHLARRVTPLMAGSSDWETLDERIAAAYGHDTRRADNDDIAPASYQGETETRDTEANENEASATSVNGSSNQNASNASVDNEANESAADEAREEARESDNKLPDTASQLPLILGFGVLLLGAATSLRWMRRRVG